MFDGERCQVGVGDEIAVYARFGQKTIQNLGMSIRRWWYPDRISLKPV